MRFRGPKWRVSVLCFRQLYTTDFVLSHTPFAGAANIQQGITIDLSALNQVTPSAGLSTVTVGPGNRWEDVYLKLDALGIAIGGGRVAIVGVGGLTLGGKSLVLLAIT